MNTSAIENAIKEAIRNNSNQEITGDIMQGILLGIVTLLKTLQEESIDSVRLESSASKIRLVITDGQGNQTTSEIDLPSGSGSGALDVQIITSSSSTAPTDSNVYSALAVDGKIKDAIGNGKITIDPIPTQNSNNAVSSGGVYNAIASIPEPAPEIFWATYGVTTTSEIQAAMDAGKEVLCKYNSSADRPAIYRLDDISYSSYVFHALLDITYVYRLSVNKNTNAWSFSGGQVQLRNIIKSTESTAPSNSNYYSALAVDGKIKDAIGNGKVRIIQGGVEVGYFNLNDTENTDINIESKGDKGDPGVSPTVAIETIQGGHQLTITDAEHPQGQSFNVMDGVVSDAPSDGKAYVRKDGAWSEGSFLKASDVATINGQSIVNGGNLEITGGTSTGIYPTYQVHCYNPVASPQVAMKKYITDFNFELGKSYRIDVDFGGENPYTGLTITLSHSDGSEGSQQVFGNFGQSIHQIFTADDDFDKMYIYYGGACDCNFTISFEDTIQNLVNGPIASDALVNKNNVANVENVLNLKRKFNTPYKFACMGDSITSDQVSGIGSLVANYLGCKLIDNYAVGSATLTNSANFVYSVDVANNTVTPYNTLTNQVVRLLQRTTPLGEQITWTHQETNENYSIPTDVATGLGFTEDIPDIIYIAIGINDNLANIGDDLNTVITQSYSELTKRTFASALRWAIETLRCVYPKVQIFVATPLFTGSANSAETYSKATVLLKRNAILESCIANGVYCIDSTMKAGYTNQISNINSQGIHPRSYNKCMIAKFIQKEIYNNYIPEIPAEEIIY